MCGDIWTWLQDGGDRVFRYWTYRRLFTPYEETEKFEDESYYEDPFASYGRIVECVELPDGDYLLGFQPVIDGETRNNVDYQHLSEIRLACYACDQPDYIEGESEVIPFGGTL